MNISSNQLLLAGGMAIAVFISPGCEKAIEFIHHHPAEDIKVCRISKLKAPGWGWEAVFSYNSAGDPTDIIATPLGSPNAFPSGQNLNYQFRYDKHHRLTDYYSYPSGTTRASEWHHYYYASAKKIIDTVSINAGNILDAEPPHVGARYTIEITLDAFGRVIKDVSDNRPGYNPYVIDYNYNEDGNLVQVYWWANYDNKINIYRTNKVWMFVYKNYSVNNVLLGFYPQLPSYNEFGLPTDYGEVSFYFWIFNYPLDNIHVEYDCDASPPGNAD